MRLIKSLTNLFTGGPYSTFAGHDASRALAFFQADLVKEVYDDLSDLDSRQMESVREWEEQFTGTVCPIFCIDMLKTSYMINQMKKRTCNDITFYADKYDFVGRLLKPGEEPTNYSDEEEGEQADESQVNTERRKDD